MIPTTLTQLMGEPPVAARVRGTVAGACGSVATHRHATRPYAGTAATRLADGNGNSVLASGFWVGAMAGITRRSIKRPTRHLASRTT